MAATDEFDNTIRAAIACGKNAKAMERSGGDAKAIEQKQCWKDAVDQYCEALTHVMNAIGMHSRPDVVSELQKHAKNFLGHACSLKKRLAQQGMAACVDPQAPLEQRQAQIQRAVEQVTKEEQEMVASIDSMVIFSKVDTDGDEMMQLVELTKICEELGLCQWDVVRIWTRMFGRELDDPQPCPFHDFVRVVQRFPVVAELLATPKGATALGPLRDRLHARLDDLPRQCEVPPPPPPAAAGGMRGAVAASPATPPYYRGAGGGPPPPPPPPPRTGGVPPPPRAPPPPPPAAAGGRTRKLPQQADARADLMAAIQAGKKLNKVGTRKEKQKPRAAPAGGGGMDMHAQLIAQVQGGLKLKKITAEDKLPPQQPKPDAQPGMKTMLRRKFANCPKNDDSDDDSDWA